MIAVLQRVSQGSVSVDNTLISSITQGLVIFLGVMDSDEKNDCELFILDELIHDNDYMKINWQRYYVFDLLEQQGIDYDQILVIDVDNIVHPDTPNFFDISDRKLSFSAIKGNKKIHKPICHLCLINF